MPEHRPVADATAPTRERIRFLLLVCAAGFAFSANYTNHAPMVAALRGEFHFDQTSAGLLTTAIFLTHALMQIPGGRLADRFGSAHMMMVALGWVFVGNVAIAFAHGYAALLSWKAFTGVGTGICFAAGARFAVTMFRGHQLHVVQGLYGASVVMGSGFVIFAVPQSLAAFGWRGAFLTCAGVALATLVFWLIAAPRQQTPGPPPADFRGMILSRQLWMLGLVQMASFGLVIVVGAWITTLLKSVLNMPLRTAGVMGSLVLLLGIASRPAGGWLASRMRPVMLIRCALLLNAAACMVLAFAESSGGIFLAIVALGMGCGLPYAVIFNQAAALFPARAGAAMGLVNMVGIGMILAGAPAVGYLADWTGQFRSSFVVLGLFAGVVGVLVRGFAWAESKRALPA